MKTLALYAIAVSSLFVANISPAGAGQAPDIRSWPPDTIPYSRPLVAEDYVPADGGPRGVAGSAGAALIVVDPIVNNSNVNLKNTDTNGDSEPSIAVNPVNPNEIVLSSFTGSSGGNSALWHSLDGGLTWTLQFTVPSAPGVPAPGFLSCFPANPCDQTFDYGRGNRLSAAFLAPFGAPDVYSGTTTNPASAAAWNWLAPMGVTQRTNNNVAGSFGNTDQPWMLVVRDPTTANQDNVYVAYDDFNGAPDMRVAVSYGLNPPNFTVDNRSGTSTGSVNPGHRLAVDPRTGFVYSLFQRFLVGGAGSSKNIDYMLNRSQDGGATWTLNGMAGGIIVANGDSDQIAPSPKFGTVNDLRGGVLHAAVDPVSGDVYYVYGRRDAGTGNNRLAVRRIQFDGSGNAVVGAEVFVTGQVQAALPGVAVSTNGTVAVLYDTFDGFSSDGFPVFTAHVALSSDQGSTFADNVLLRFLSPAKDTCPMLGVNCNDRQRVFGDYQQMKVVGQTFYGVFSGNGAAFGRSVANIDPIFFKIGLGPQIQIPGDVSLPDACTGSTSSATLKVCNTGNENLQVTAITSSNAVISVTTPSSGYPIVISPDFCFPFDVQFAPMAAGLSSANLTISSNDSANPTAIVQATGSGGDPEITVDPAALSGQFAFPPTVADPNGSLGCFADQTLTIRNTGSCPLVISNIGAASSPPFHVIAPTVLPITLRPGEETLEVTVRFAPKAGGGSATAPDETTGQVTIASNDPASPATIVPLCGEAVARSGVRIVLVDGADVPVPKIGSLRLHSRGIFFPKAVRFRQRHVPLTSALVCGNTVPYHLDREDLPTTLAEAIVGHSSYDVRIRDETFRKHVRKSFDLGECEFRRLVFQLP